MTTSCAIHRPLRLGGYCTCAMCAPALQPRKRSGAPSAAIELAVRLLFGVSLVGSAYALRTVTQHITGDAQLPSASDAEPGQQEQAVQEAVKHHGQP